MADRAGLAGNTAASNPADNVKFLIGLGGHQRLANDQLQGLQAKVIVDITVVDCNPVPWYTLTRATELFLLPVP